MAGERSRGDPQDGGAANTSEQIKRGRLEAMPTSEVELRPSFVTALKAAAPRSKGPSVRYALLLAVLVIALAFAAMPVVRRAAIAKMRGLLAPTPPSIGSVDPVASNVESDLGLPAPSTPSSSDMLLASAAPSASATPSASSSSAPTKPPKKPRRPGR